MARVAACDVKPVQAAHRLGHIMTSCSAGLLREYGGMYLDTDKVATHGMVQT
jgi:hypothetical protein